VRTILLACLTFIANSAWAEWVQVAENSGGKYYIDPSKIRVEDNLREVWVIRDFTVPDLNGAKSDRARKVYDCKDERVITLFLSSHSKPMAKGKTLSKVDGSIGWTDIVSNSSSARILEAACAK
jgi:hypothetical protein